MLTLLNQVTSTLPIKFPKTEEMLLSLSHGKICTECNTKLFFFANQEGNCYTLLHRTTESHFTVNLALTLFYALEEDV